MDPSHLTILSHAQHGDISALYSAIMTDPKVLDEIDEIQFAQTPLHTAALAGRTEFAMEIMMLKPSFARKLNKDGFTPMHLALQRKHKKLALQLLDVDNALVRVQGRGGVTPLHYATEIEQLDILVEFLKACPHSIQDVTSRKETALHVALKHKRFGSFKLLVGWLRRAWFIRAAWWEKKLLNSQDCEDNTPLHLAVSTNRPEVVGSFVYCTSVDKDIKNSNRQTALEISEQFHESSDGAEIIKKMIHNAKIYQSLYQFLFPSPSLPENALVNFLSSPFSIYENYYVFMFRQNMDLSNDTRNMLLVVAALVVTVTYQAVMSPPGGIWQDNPNAETPNNASKLFVSHHLNLSASHHAGRVIMSTSSSYLFFSLNTLTFFTVNMTIIFLLPLGFTRFLVIFPLWALTSCYCASAHIILPTVSSYSYLLLLLLASLFFVFSNYSWFSKLRNLIQAFRPIAQMLDPSFTWGWYNF